MIYSYMASSISIKYNTMKYIRLFPTNTTLGLSGPRNNVNLILV